ncbi:stalk domain-containing protein [Paenibacillus ginsengarvi]|uniref:Copper amine oxidase n=1 Tax=Paenibacillus ginsengarvi TaxID=400777 RepID=A0A3B0CLY9_9BACL|nr:stalk domain-containing protein [Paenibacillus ginsengarvi]RKN85990.1 copper amine oxidase [Paenibacillus ginsengarvi]
MKRLFSLWLACFLVFACLASSVSAASAAPERYVVFGDSIAIGFEPGMTVDSIPYGYSDRVYEQALLHGRATAANYGIGGLTSAGLKTMLQAVADGKKIKGSDLQPSLPDPRADQVVSDTAKIKADIAAATLITITIGGNDIGSKIITDLQNMNDADLDAFAATWMKTYTDNVTSTLQNIFTINKNVRVYIADQYSPVPAFMKAEYAKAQKLKDLFTATLKQIEQSFTKNNFKVTAVPVAAAFVGSEGTFTHIAEKDIHPNQSGYEKIAELFAKSIWGDYRDDLAKTDPITVVVGGRTIATPHLPALIGDSTFVPLREYSEALGATVDWNDETKTATVRYNGSSVALTLDSTTISVNGTAKQIETAAPHAHDSNGEMKTYIPLRLMAEGLGFDVQYVQQSRTAFINS